MADQNQDGKGMTAGGTLAGSSERLRDDAPKTTGSAATTSTASSAAGSSGGMDAGYSGAGMTGRSTNPGAMGGVKEGTSRLASGARQYADDIASKAREKSRTMFDQQKETAVGQVSNVASAIRSTATQLQGEGQDQIARYIDMMADRLENLGGRLREKDLDTLIDDAQNLARRSPATFFIGSVAAGFLLARFLKSSSVSGVEYRGYSGEQDDKWRSAAATSSGAYMGASAGGGTTGTSGTTGTTGTTGTSGTSGTMGVAGTVGSGGAGRGVGADGTPGGTGTTIGSSATPVNGSGAGGPSI